MKTWPSSCVWDVELQMVQRDGWLIKAPETPCFLLFWCCFFVWNKMPNVNVRGSWKCQMYCKYVFFCENVSEFPIFLTFSKRDDVLRVVEDSRQVIKAPPSWSQARVFWWTKKNIPSNPVSAAVAVARNGHGFFSDPGGQKYVCLQATEITEALDVSSTSIRMLAEGELIEVYLWRQVVNDGIECLWFLFQLCANFF